MSDPTWETIGGIVMLLAVLACGAMVGYSYHSCDCSLPATTGAGQGSLDRG